VGLAGPTLVLEGRVQSKGNGVFAEGVRVVGLVAKNSPDYFAKFFDYMAAGTVVVPLRSADDAERRAACGISEVVIPDDGYGWTDRTGALPKGDETAQIAFTSGTQGEPKGVILTRTNLTSTVERLCSIMELDSSIREYVGVPVHHSFGLGRCRAVAAVGGRAFIPRSGFNPREIAAMLADGEINAISAVPTLWRSLLRAPEILGGLGERVRWIEIGSQPMSRDEKIAMRSLFPNARIVQHYGLTEASRTTFLDISGANLEELDSVGAPNGDVQVDLTNEGLIKIRGSNVAAELLIGGRRVPNTDENGWHVTKDLGEIRGGMLYFKGRADDVMNLGGLKVSADLLETDVASALGIEGALSVVRVADKDRGDGVLLAVLQDCPVGDQRIVEAASAALQKLGISAGSSLHLLRVDSFPETHSGKIKRHAIADLYEEGRSGAGGAASAAAAGAGTGTRRARRGPLARLKELLAFERRDTVRTIFEDLFPGAQIGASDTFVGLGGDSLKYIEVAMSLESLLGRLPDNWENLSIEELEGIRPRQSTMKTVDTTVLLRFVAIILIVSLHLTAFNYPGATYMLFVVAGFNFARFQLGNVLATGEVKSILLSALRVAIPTLLLLFALQAKDMTFQLDKLFLVSNYVVTETWEAYYWYVEAYIQILLAFALLLVVPSVRAMAKAHLLSFTLGLLALSLVAARFGPLLWNTEPLYDHVPHMLFWLFLLGWVLEQAKEPRQKLVAAACALVAPAVAWGLGEQTEYVGIGPYYVWAGCAVMILLDKVALPAPLAWVVYRIGSASLFIYITHWTTSRYWRRLSPVDSGVLTVIAVIVAGVVLWFLWERFSRYVVRAWSQRSLAVAG
jgi:acyl-CoA synthetase (AMP-forming)/AMP-acid ligase II